MASEGGDAPGRLAGKEIVTYYDLEPGCSYEGRHE
jgi:hypothetical protein